jgi:tRNA threonylcarbamoyladenosine biosynthesis protein TsaE
VTEQAAQARAVHQWTTRSAAETQALGAALGAAVQAGQVIALRGDLGAGKTTFVQGLARGLGVHSRVASPTFVLVNEYRAAGRGRLFHVDTYRLGASIDAEAATMGLEELLEDTEAVTAIEWADRVAALLPPDHLLVELEYGAQLDVRVIRISAFGAKGLLALQTLSSYHRG